MPGLLIADFAHPQSLALANRCRLVRRLRSESEQPRLQMFSWPFQPYFRSSADHVFAADTTTFSYVFAGIAAAARFRTHAFAAARRILKCNIMIPWVYFGSLK
jgi:hypothetical protein